jgi:hypothetical protein
MSKITFTTHNDARVSIVGTYFLGKIQASYDEIVSLFGKPYDGDKCNTDAEWDILFEDGVVATIYNWKNGVNHCGLSGTPVEHIYEWCVGGKKLAALHRVMDLLEKTDEDFEKYLHEQIQQRQREYDETITRIGHLIKQTTQSIQDIEAILRKS